MAKVIAITQNNKSYKIVSTFLDKSIEITILQQGLAYAAKVSEEHVNHWASSLGVDDEKYFISLKQYLTNANSEVSIDISDSELNIYKSKNDKYFIVPLIENDYKSTIEKLIDSLTMKNIEIKSFNEDLIKKENESRAAASQKAKELTDFAYECSETKENAKSASLIILNSKKRRIQFLIDIINGDNFEIKTKRANLLRAAKKAASADNVCTNDDSQKSAEETPDQEIASNRDDDVFAVLDENEIDMLTVPFRKPQEAASTSTTVTEATNKVVEPNDDNIIDTSSENTQDLICSTQDLLQRIN